MAASENRVRQEEFSYRPGLIRSVLQSFYYCLDYVLGQWTDWKIILFVILIVLFAIHAVQEYKGDFSFRFQVLVLLWSYCVLVSMFTENIYVVIEVLRTLASMGLVGSKYTIKSAANPTKILIDRIKM